MDGPKVVIAGAGFAGVKVAKLLRGKADVTLVAPTDRFTYLPLIHELVSEHETPRTVAKRLDGILPHVQRIESRIVAVEDKEAITAEGQRLPFDYFVNAIGAQPNDFGIAGVRDHTFSFYSVRDALLANGQLKAAAASVYGRPVTVAVIGASFTGIEVAGEVRALMDKLDVPCDIELLDAGDGFFPHQSKGFQDAVADAVQQARLHVTWGARISTVNEDVVVVNDADGRRATTADVILWCAGAKPRTIAGVDPDVDATLRSLTRPDVFCVGDAAQFPREMGVPRLAQTAEQQAPIVAHNLLRPDDPKEYQVELKGIIVSVGPDRAVAEVAGKVLTGRVPSRIKKRLYKAKIALA